MREEFNAEFINELLKKLKPSEICTLISMCCIWLAKNYDYDMNKFLKDNKKMVMKFLKEHE